MLRLAELRVDSLQAGYGRLSVLRGVSFGVEAGRPCVVLGANGAGKTTLCRAISGLVSVTGGSISFAGQDLGPLRPAARVRAGIAQVPEGRQVFPEMTVRDNLRLGGFVLGEPAPAEFEAAFELFPVLADRMGHNAGLLSGGEQQMLALARALMARPKLLLLDEPSQGLAPKAVALVGAAINRIAATGVAILLVEQNLFLAEMVGQHAVVLETGRCVTEGPLAGILASGVVEQSYLGHQRRTQ